MSNMKRKISSISTPTEIEYRSVRLLITDCPTEAILPAYIQDLKRHNAPVLVRVCEATYDADVLRKEGILVTDLIFDDGGFPAAQVRHRHTVSNLMMFFNQVISSWLKLVRAQWVEDPASCVAVHCVAGLGRAPVLVALALMELGLPFEDAVHLIRQKRRGAINAKQLVFLQKYRPRSRLRIRSSTQSTCCFQ